MQQKMIEQIKMPLRWSAPKGWLKISTIDAHTGGEPLRIIIDGFPEIKGRTILEKRRYCRENFDHLRRALMWEPRGHADMYGCIVTEPVTADADFGVLFLHNEGFSTMCGHGIIAVTKVMLETGAIRKSAPETIVNINTPAGLVTAYACIRDDRVESVYFHNVPSFVLAMDQSVQVQGMGDVNFDIAFGGAFYAFVNADALGLSLAADNYRRLIEAGMDIKRAVMRNYKIEHPFEKDLNFLYGTIFIGKPLNEEAHSRNVCIFAEGEVDRSPTGTGVSARMALHHARAEIKSGEAMVIESIIGSAFTGRVVRITKFGPYDAVIPEVEGTAFITGKNEFVIDPGDPLRDGFVLR